jgi:peptidoglycan/LPS O-acetylase OafA/YrhL
MNQNDPSPDGGPVAPAAVREASRERPKIQELESIRGLAAMLVVFYHTPRWNPLCNIGIINNGYIMVDLFFVLSGFVIYKAYAEKINSKSDLCRFQFLRFGRLYPVHITLLFVFLAIEVAKYAAKLKYGVVSPNSRPFEYNNLAAFVENLFLLTAVIPNNWVSFDYPAWSISAEFYTYLVFGLIVLYWRKAKAGVFGALAAVSLVMVTTNVTFGMEPMLRCFAGFWLGAVTGRIIEKSQAKIPDAFAIGIFAALILFLQFKTPHHGDSWVYFLTAALIIALVLAERRILNQALNHKILTWLGTISYSIYMTHAAVGWGINQVIRVILRYPEAVQADGRSTPQLTGVETVIAYAAMVACVLAFSQLVYSFIEEPLRKKSRRYAARCFAPPEAVASPEFA